MTTSAVELAVASAMTIAVTEDTLTAELMDGRTDDLRAVGLVSQAGPRDA